MKNEKVGEGRCWFVAAHDEIDDGAVLSSSTKLKTTTPDLL